MTRRAFLKLLSALALWRWPADESYWRLGVSRLGIDTILAPSPDPVPLRLLWLPYVGN